MSERFYKFMRFVATPVIFLMTKYIFINKNRVPKTGKLIVCSNHIHATDPICIGMANNRPIRFMAKKELFSNKIASWFFTKLGGFPVDREKNDIHAMKMFIKGLNDEQVMGIFFEGTRSKTGEFLEPKDGASLFAYQCKSPILPVCITQIGKRRYFHFGEILSVDDLGFNDKDLSKQEKISNATKIVFEEIKKLREMDLKNAGEIS